MIDFPNLSALEYPVPESSAQPEGNYVQSHQWWMGENISLMVQHVIMMLTQGTCLFHCCCSRCTFMFLWVFLSSAIVWQTPSHHIWGLILQTGSSWISFYLLQDHFIFKILLWLLTVTLPCRTGGQLADTPWQTEVAGKCQFPSSAKIALEGRWRMNWTGARNQKLGPVVLLQLQFFVSVHASKAALVWAVPPKNFIELATCCFCFLCQKTGTDKAFRGAEDHTEAVSQLAQATVVDAGLIHISSSLHRGSYCQNCRWHRGLLPTCVLVLSVRDAFCSCLPLHCIKDVSNALEWSVQISLGIAELLRDSELLLTHPKTMNFPTLTGTLLPTARRSLTTLQKYERVF